MIKNYIIDTNVLLANPESIFKFEDNIVIIPIGVIEELDKFKKDMTELGRNARQVSRILDELREKGDLKEGVPLGNGILKVRYNGNLKSFYKESNVDLHVIHIAQETVKRYPKDLCIIVSNDVNVRIRANALGLRAQKYEGGSIQKDEIEKGYSEIDIDEDLFNEFAKNKEISFDSISGLPNFPKVYPNHYLTLFKNTDRKSLLGRINSDMTLVKRLIGSPKKIKLTPRNKEQSFLIDALMDRDIKLVSVAGKAGSGKTLLSTAIAYYLTVEEKEYKRMLVSRPIYPLGKDIGFLPGDLDEKLDPWMVPIYDAFDVINDNQAESGRDFVKKNPLIIVEPLTYIRGRSIHDQFLIVDEAQNLTPLEIKTIITRAGDGTKVVLTGDVQQIDNPYIDSLSNGLSVVMAAFRGSKIAAGLVLEKGVRSALAEEASNKLK